MKLLRKLTLALLCVLTAAGSLLAALPLGMGACASGNHNGTGESPTTPCQNSCCELSAAAAPCSCCVAPTPATSQPKPTKSCSACPCGTPADAVPPAGPSNNLAPADAVAAVGVVSLDVPAQAPVVGRSLLMHHPPPVADLVTSLSRFTC